MGAEDPTREPNPVEVRARDLLREGQPRAAATAVIEAYGPELLGWLRAVAGGDAEADDVFSIVCERLWSALPKFDWRGSIRTWMYVVGRNALRDRYRRRRGRVNVPLSQSPELAAAIRSSTAAYRKTEQKDRLAQIREQMTPDERTLLVLRVHRELPWRDIAEILTGGDASGEELARASARARKQFARLKERLRAAWNEPPSA